MHTTVRNKTRTIAKNSKQWIAYFKANRESLLSIPWHSNYKVTAAERSCISKSLSIFQLGESSEGNRLRKLAARKALQCNDPALPHAMDLFIHEEQRHASDLANFLSQQHIPLRKIHWTDLVFRFLRRFWNFETCLSVLLTAELVAKIYYRALRKATASPVLQKVCTQLLKDEVQHLCFHAQNLGMVQGNRGRYSAFLWQESFLLFYAVTLCAVWTGHRRVFHAAGITFLNFWKESQANAVRALHSIGKFRMKRNHKSNPISTYRTALHFQTTEAMQFLDITDQVAAAVRKSHVRLGVANIQTQHTTTGLMVNENEPLLLQDIKRVLKKIAPEEETYLHNDFSIRTVNLEPFEDKNGHAHCRALFLRTSESINIVAGRLALGRWQRLFLIECDKSRARTVNVLIFGR